MSALPQENDSWEFSEAQEKLGELMDRAISEGPQKIRRGDDVVTISKVEKKVSRKTINEVLLSIPKDPPGEPSFTEIIMEGRRYFNDYDH